MFFKPVSDDTAFGAVYVKIMPVYEYYCPTNERQVEVVHGMNTTLSTWEELCKAADMEMGDTPPESPVERLLFAVGVNTPQGNAELKNMGFTKLVKRDSGVYENVTRTGSESRYMNANDSSTLPDIKGKIAD